MKKKLSLNKEVVTRLNDSQMESVKGGTKMTQFCTTAITCGILTQKGCASVKYACTTAITCTCGPITKYNCI